jgi:hypothetical protein
MVTNQARGAALATTPGGSIEIAKAIPAKAGGAVQFGRRDDAHGTSRSHCGSFNA